MEKDFQSRILRAVYEYYESNPGSPEMTLAELYMALNIPLDDEAQRSSVVRHLLSLQEKEWVGYKLLDRQNGTVEITWEGMRVAQGAQETKASEPTGDNSEPYPTNLGALASRDPSCARLIQRDELLREILGYFNQPSRPYHLFLLCGQPMVGKTRFLKHVSEALDGKYIPLLVTLEGSKCNKALENPDAFMFDLAQQLTDRFGELAERRGLQSLSSPSRGDFEGKGRTAFDIHWNRLRASAKKCQPVVMFDEIETLLDRDTKLDLQVLTFLSDFVRNPRNGYFILVWSDQARDYLELRRKYPRVAEYGKRIRQFDKLIRWATHVPVPYYDEDAVRRIFSTTEQYFQDGDTLRCILSLCDGQPKIVDVTFHQVVHYANRPPGRRKIKESDIEPILATTIESASYHLLLMTRRLSEEEVRVVWLISQELTDPRDGLEYSLSRLVGLANEHFVNSSVDHSTLIERGVARLESREWIEWTDRPKRLFRFKLGIVPLWISRNRLSLDEVRH